MWYLKYDTMFLFISISGASNDTNVPWNGHNEDKKENINKIFYERFTAFGLHPRHTIWEEEGWGGSGGGGREKTAAYICLILHKTKIT